MNSELVALRPYRPIGLTRPRIMGIVNVTPDSFSDGGDYLRLDAAIAHAEALVAAGAQLVVMAMRMATARAPRILLVLIIAAPGISASLQPRQGSPRSWPATS